MAQVDHTVGEVPVEAHTEDEVPLAVGTEEIAQVAVDTKEVAVLEKEVTVQATVLTNHHTVLIVQREIVRHTEVIDHNVLLVDTKEAVHAVEDILVIDHDPIVQATVLLVQRELEGTKEVAHESNDDMRQVVTVANDQIETTNTRQPDSNSMLLVPTKSHENPTVIAQNVAIDQPVDTRKNPTPHHDHATTPEVVATSDGHVKMKEKINYNIRKLLSEFRRGVFDLIIFDNFIYFREIKDIC